MFERRTLAALTSVTAALGVALALAGPAQADSVTGGTTDSSVQASGSATVVVKGGPGDPLAGSGSVSVSVPPKCWWEPFNTENLAYYDIDPDDPQAMKKYFQGMIEHTTITFVPSRLAYPSREYIKAHLGPDWQWYVLAEAPGVNCIDEGFAQKGGDGPPGWGEIAISYQAFRPGNPPPPLVDVEDVVTEVWDAVSQEVEGPQLDRNPKIANVNGATLVNLSTWFWVQNVREALAEDGKIHLELSIPGTPVRATVDAATDGVQITSPAGATVCSVPAAKTEWSAGASEASACTIPFDRANRAGWPVTARTTWTGSWQGTDHNGPVGGTLTALTPSATVSVPVAESQALVTDVD